MLLLVCPVCLTPCGAGQMGLALPFASEVNYSAWVTVIPEAAFARNPLRELDSVVEALLWKGSEVGHTRFRMTWSLGSTVDITCWWNCSAWSVQAST